MTDNEILTKYHEQLDLEIKTNAFNNEIEAIRFTAGYVTALCNFKIITINNYKLISEIYDICKQAFTNVRIVIIDKTKEGE